MEKNYENGEVRYTAGTWNDQKSQVERHGRHHNVEFALKSKPYFFIFRFLFL